MFQTGTIITVRDGFLKIKTAFPFFFSATTTHRCDSNCWDQKEKKEKKEPEVGLVW